LEKQKAAELAKKEKQFLNLPKTQKKSFLQRLEISHEIENLTAAAKKIQTGKIKEKIFTDFFNENSTPKISDNGEEFWATKLR